MRLISLIFAATALLSVVTAKCCRSDFGGDSRDNSAGTPCCGYRKCNARCCNCQGVGAVQYTATYSGLKTTKGATISGAIKTTMTITAPAGEMYTCRDDKWGDHTDLPPDWPLVTITPRAFGADGAEGYDDDSEGEFERLSNGTGRLGLDEYLRSFDVEPGVEGDFAKVVAEKFMLHDEDGDGVLSLEKFLMVV